MKRFPLAVAVVLMITCGVGQAYAFSKIINIGDSLSDVGNVLYVTTGAAPFVDPLPSYPYWEGRFSNGPVWVEHLAEGLGLNRSVPYHLGGLNYAFGGAESDFDLPLPFFGINLDLPGIVHNGAVSQMSVHVVYGQTESNDLFTIWAGANDILNGDTNTLGMAINITSIALFLHDNAGARNFLIPNLPPLGQTPRFKNSLLEGWMDWLASSYNDTLDATLNWLQIVRPDVTIYRLNVHGLFTDMSSNPTAYGFSNISEPAYSNGNVVTNPDEYLFWDEIHPTRRGHEIIGQEALKLLPSP